MPDPDDFVLAQQQAAAAAFGGNKQPVAWQQNKPLSATIASQPAYAQSNSQIQGMKCKKMLHVRAPIVTVPQNFQEIFLQGEQNCTIRVLTKAPNLIVI